MADVQATATLNVKQILDALNAVDKTNDKVWKNAEKSANRAIKGIIADHKRLNALTSKLDKDLAGNAKGFGDIGKSAQASGVQIGAVAGIVTALTSEFVNLGKQAIGALVGIAKEGFNTALEFDTLRSRLLGIFDGSKPAAEEAFNFIQEKSKELGINLSELAGAFLPKVESLEQFERVAKIATALARSDPNGTGGPVGARIALQEAISGDFISLQKRFEFDDAEINKIKKAFKDTGIDGFLTALEEVQEASGRAFGDFANTAQGAINRVNTQLEQLKAALGVPIVEELKEQFLALFAVMEGREDDLLLIADTFGRVAANIVEIIGAGLTDFLTNLDSEQIVHIGETIFDITEDIKVLGELLLGVEFPSSFADGVETAATKLKEMLETTIKLNLISAAGAARAKAEYQAWADEMERLHGEGTITTEVLKEVAGIPGVVQASNALAPFIGDQEAAALAAKSAAAGQAAYNKVILDGVGAIDEATQASDANRQATEDRTKAIDAAKTATGGDSDALLGQAAAARAAADAAEELAGAQAKVSKAQADAKQDFDQKLEDIDIAAERKRLDIQIEFAQKREDAARDHLQKLADIQEKNQDDITDAATDLERKEDDIARKFAQERIDLERDQRQKRVDIEKDFREKLQDIQSESAFDLEEAERNRDAVGFLRILRQQQKQVSQAQTDRQREIDELRVNGELKKEELATQQQREIEDAHIANERKLQDLQLNLERQIEAQNAAFARQIEDIAINEQRKNEEATRARERDIEDAKLAYERKLADLQESLAAELAIIAAGNAAIEEEARRHAAEMAAAAASARVQSQARADDDTPDSRPGQQNRRRQRAGQPGSRPGFINTGRALGGPVMAGRSYTVGERGPELFTPNISGVIIPNQRAMISSGGAGSGGVNNFNNQRAINAPITMTDPNSLSAVQRAIIRAEILAIMNQID